MAINIEKIVLMVEPVKPVIYEPSIQPWAVEASNEPIKKNRFHMAFFPSPAFTRKSKATPRKISPNNMIVAGKYKVVKMMP